MAAYDIATIGQTLGDMIRAETAHQRYLLERLEEAKARKDDAEAEIKTLEHSLWLTHWSPNQDPING